MLESLQSDTFEYTKLTPEEQSKRGILGRLTGIIADFKKPTRNGRLYPEELWEKVFSDPIMQEKIKNRCVFGELGHPADRIETDMEKIAICLAEVPKKGKDGKLHGVFDIIDTPNGRILKTMCDYGCTIGISSRGNGELVTDFNGNESVDPDTYECECWDAVLLPGVETARLQYVTESLENKKTLKQALNEALETASPDAKKIMLETLDRLNIDYTPEKVDNKSEIAANDDGAKMVKELQESLLKQQAQETQITELQEKLSVCYAKEARYDEDIQKYKNAIRNLSESASSAKALQSKVKELTEQLNQKDLRIKEEQDKCQAILEQKQVELDKQSRLTESISNKTYQLRNKDLEIARLNESLETLKKESDEKELSLNESIAEIKKNLTIKTTEYNTKLSNANKLVEQYRNTAKTAVNKYINSQALRLGVDAQEVKNKLPENYSFSDIDEICESLSSFNLTVSSLPLNLSKGKPKFIVNESKQPTLTQNTSECDDSVDESLLRMVERLTEK